MENVFENWKIEIKDVKDNILLELWKIDMVFNLF